jgi:hypothetical protein
MKPIVKAMLCSVVALSSLTLSCGHPTTLQSLEIQPGSINVAGAGSALASLPVQFTAYGHFIHPTEVRDVTTEVTWSTDVPIVTVGAHTGIVTPAGDGSCGGALITATAHKGVIGPGTAEAVITQTATFDVQDTNYPKGTCP